MRIISGTLKGRRFNPPADSWPTRPTTDFAKEGLFNILNNLIDFEETRVLDLFGGTGNHTFEFVSRGCREVTYVDRHRPAIEFVRKTAADWNIEDRISIQPGDVFVFIERAARQWDYIFAGPPYGMPRLDELPDLIIERGMIAPEGLFVLEHNPNHDFTHHPQLTDIRHYGKTVFSFFEPTVP
jgi:16S rRNA (guanine(966)-N(2))-methyltransferase RsmD